MRGVKAFNAPAFNAADDALQAAGHTTFNPARVDEANGFDLMGYDGTEDLTSIGFNLRDVLGADLAWIAEHADGVAVLPGWEKSMGAKAEVATADALGLPVRDVDYWAGDFGCVVKYVPAIGDRVRIVDADCLGSGEHVGTVTDVDAPQVWWADRPHPIEVTHDGDQHWWAVEVELIETAAEIAEYEEGLAEAQRTCGVPQRLMVGADPSDALPHPARLSEPEREDMAAWYAGTADSEVIAAKEAFSTHEPLTYIDIPTGEASSDWYMNSDDAQDLIVARPDDGAGWLDDRTYVSDNEVRVTSETGGQKGQKPAQLSTVDAVALLKLAEVGGYGGRKYEPHNYLRGYAWSLSLDALWRHVLAFESGEDFDPESGLPHVTHAAWHCLALTSFMVRGLGTDDRFKQEGSVQL